MRVFLVVALLVMVMSVAGVYYFKSDNISKCKDSETSTPYCQYKGKIKSIYMNENGLILIGLYETVNKEEASKFGFELKTTNYFSIKSRPENIQFTNTVLRLGEQAIQSNLSIEMHARDVSNGMMVIDRIWLLDQ